MPPHRILALTFTNKAAREMKSRITALEGEKNIRGLWMGTFHSTFAKILRREAQHLEYTPDFTIYDSADSKNLLKTIIKERSLDDKHYKPSKILSVISMAKNQLISPEQYRHDRELTAYDQKSQRPLMGEIYQTYCSRMKKSNTMDFDDLLYNTNILFRDFPDILKFYQEQFQFILVDEYQDTNFSQSVLIHQLAALHHRVCVVGDDAQSIYSFRGANIANILNFKTQYPEAKIFKLEQNYRSTQNIVNAANSLIKQNKDQLEKNVFSKNESGEKISLTEAFSDFEEGIIVSNKISHIHTLQKQPYSHFAILYRTNAQSRIFEEALRKKNIPYQIYGGLSFYQRKEIKDVIAYFRFIINPHDQEALKRIINFPTRGIGSTTVTKIAEAARIHTTGMWNIILNPPAFNLNINNNTAKKLSAFRDMILRFQEQLSSHSAGEIASIVIKESGIMQDAYQDKSPESMSKQENLQELINGMYEFAELRKEEGDTQYGLTSFLSEVALLTDQDTNTHAQEEKVTLMTIHAAKGLEFKHIFIVGLEEELFPSSLSLWEPQGIEEERRLFYVALTRAEQTCTLTYSRSRYRNGSTYICRPSRFLSEIDPQFIDKKENNLPFSAGRLQDTSPSGAKANSTTVQHHMPTPSHNVQTQPATDHTSTLMSHNSYHQLSIGDKIIHERFGVGVVLALTGEAESSKATVDFQNTGTKQLLLKFAKLKKL